MVQDLFKNSEKFTCAKELLDDVEEAHLKDLRINMLTEIRLDKTKVHKGVLSMFILREQREGTGRPLPLGRG